MFKISFDFDEITGTVTNMKVNKSDGVKIRGGFNASPNVQPTDVPDIVVEENRLLISPSALATMDVKADDRISIQYWNEGIGSSACIAAIGLVRNHVYHQVSVPQR